MTSSLFSQYPYSFLVRQLNDTGLQGVKKLIASDSFASVRSNQETGSRKVRQPPIETFRLSFSLQKAFADLKAKADSYLSAPDIDYINCTSVGACR